MKEPVAKKAAGSFWQKMRMERTGGKRIKSMNKNL